MKFETIVDLVFDAVMHCVVKALPARIETAVEARVEAAVETRVAAMVQEIGQLATSVEKCAGAVVGYVSRSDLEDTVARCIDSFTKMSRLEMQRIVSAMRIESDADGFLVLTNERDGVRAPLGFRPFQYHGTYEPEKKYLINDAVTNRGSLWIARARVSGVSPGTDDGAPFWTLAVKCGKDARVNGGTNGG